MKKAEKMKKVKITVMKIAVHQDLIDKYENPILHACLLKVGDTFISKNGQKPKDFCESAWSVIEPFVNDLANGKNNFYDGWMKDPDSAMISCNDGFRPVSFFIEIIE